MFTAGREKVGEKREKCTEVLELLRVLDKKARSSSETSAKKGNEIN